VNPRSDRLVHVAAIRDPEADADRVRELYERLAEAKRSVGEAPVPFDRVAALVQAQVQKLRGEGRDVAFRVALKEFNRRRGTRGVVRTMRETKDPTLLVVLFEDSVAVLGLVVAAAGLLLAHWTGESYWDAVASMAIGVLLAVTAVILAVETKGLLMGESAGREVRSAIRAAVLAVPEVEWIDRLLTMHLGPEEILVNMDLVLDPGLSEAEAEVVVRRVEEEIRRLVPQATRVFIELGAGG